MMWLAILYKSKEMFSKVFDKLIENFYWRSLSIMLESCIPTFILLLICQSPIITYSLSKFPLIILAYEYPYTTPCTYTYTHSYTIPPPCPISSPTVSAVYGTRMEENTFSYDLLLASFSLKSPEIIKLALGAL